jgi:hypothetical protein
MQRATWLVAYARSLARDLPRQPRIRRTPLLRAAAQSPVAGCDEQITPVLPREPKRFTKAIEVTAREHKRGVLNTVALADDSPSRQVCAEPLEHGLRTGLVIACEVVFDLRDHSRSHHGAIIAEAINGRPYLVQWPSSGQAPNGRGFGDVHARIDANAIVSCDAESARVPSPMR